MPNTATIRNTPFQNVVPNGRASASFDNVLGSTLERLILVLGSAVVGADNFKAQHITRIELKANAKTIAVTSGLDIKKRMAYRGIPQTDNMLVLDFTELKARTIMGQGIGALDTTIGINSLTMEVTIAGAISPTLESYSVISPRQVDSVTKQDLVGRGMFSKVLRFPHSFSGTGKQSLRIPFGPQGGTLIKRICLMDTGGIDSAEVKTQGIVVFDNVPVALNDYIQSENGRVPQDNMYVIDFVVDGNQSHMLDTRALSNLELYVALNKAEASLEVVVECVDTLANN